MPGVQGLVEFQKGRATVVSFLCLGFVVFRVLFGVTVIGFRVYGDLPKCKSFAEAVIDSQISGALFAIRATVYGGRWVAP